MSNLTIVLIYVYIYIYVCVANLVAPWGTYFPTDLLKDPVLSSVVSMVTPTWCHGATGGIPV